MQAAHNVTFWGTIKSSSIHAINDITVSIAACNSNYTVPLIIARERIVCRPTRQSVFVLQSLKTKRTLVLFVTVSTVTSSLTAHKKINFAS